MRFQPQVAFLVESARNKNEVVNTLENLAVTRISQLSSQAATDGVKALATCGIY